MQKKSVIIFLGLLVLLAASAILPSGSSKSGGIAANDVESNGGCTCHEADAASGVTAKLEGLPTTFEASSEHELTLSMTGGPAPGGSNEGGFTLKASGGTFTVTEDTTQKMSDGSVTQRSAGNDQRSWKVNWTAPADDTKELTFDLWVNAVNGDGSNNADDDWNTVEKKVKGANYTPASDPDGDDSPGLGLLMVMTATMMAVAGTCLIRNRK